MRILFIGTGGFGGRHAETVRSLQPAAELFALRGMQQTLEKFRPTVLIEIEPEFLGGFGIKEADLTTFFADAGYKAYLYDSGTDRLQEHSAGKPYCSSNYILIHKDKERVFSGLLAAA